MRQIQGKLFLEMGKPMHTIYINNLNEKIKLDGLKKGLKAVFSQFGEIVDIIVAKHLKMHGQAFVAFKEKSSATAALGSMQGFPFYDKQMRIQYAKKEADCISKLLGTYIKKEPFTPPTIKKKSKNKSSSKQKVPPSTGVPVTVAPNVVPHTFHNSVPLLFNANSTPCVPPMNMEAPPNNILFVTNVPESANQMTLNLLFNQFPKLKEVRLVPSRPDIAFVEYESLDGAIVAKKTLQGFNLTPMNSLNITFAKQ